MQAIAAKLLIPVAILTSLNTTAMPVKSQMLKPRAYFTEADNNLLEPLDLKSKTLTFSKAEFENCGTGLMRKAQTLSYSCSLPIPNNSKVSKMQNLVTPKKVPVQFGGTKREVQIEVSPDARQITLSMAFDHTGIDFEVSKFNDDFFAVYAKVAQLILTEAMQKQPVRIEVLESR